MERSAWPKNLTSSRKHAIQDLLHAQNPTKKFTDIFDIHSQTGNITGQPLFAEHLVVSVLGSFSNTLSPSSSTESDEVLQVPTNACVTSEVSGGSESINTPLPRRTLDTRTRLDQNLINEGQQWRTYHQESIINFELPGSYFRCAHQIDQGCQATKLVERTSRDPRLFLITYRGRHTGEIILESAQLILDSPSPRDGASIPQSVNTSRIAEQGDDGNIPIFFDFLSMNQEQKLPSEDDLNPHGHSHGNNSDNSNQFPSSDYDVAFEFAAEIPHDLDDMMPRYPSGDNSTNNSQSLSSNYDAAFGFAEEISTVLGGMMLPRVDMDWTFLNDDLIMLKYFS